MAGGIWSSQNKVRPGAYINFETDNLATTEIGSRGIATIAMELDWGAEGKLIELTVDDIYGGNSLAKVGFMADADAALLPKLALQNAEILKVFRLNKNGVKATASLLSSALTVTAKYPGTFGNKIAIVITANANSTYNVQTYADGYLVDNQMATTIGELKNNAFVDFSGTGNLDAVTSTLLTGGTNGGVPTKGTGTTYTSYDDYFEALKTARWNTMAVIIANESLYADVYSFIQSMRNNEGKYVQAVVSNAESVDYEGIINNINGVVIDNIEISAVQFTAWVAGATAGAEVNESLTGRVITNATSIIDLKENDEIIAGLKVGQFLLSLNQDGGIKVEKDINSLHTFTEKSYIFSKNRVIRELDEIGSGIESIWENTYLGKVNNNDNGRTLFKSSIIDFLTELRNRGAINEFDVDAIAVDAGADIDAVVATLAVKPLDSMEFLYMTVNINQ